MTSLATLTINWRDRAGATPLSLSVIEFLLVLLQLSVFWTADTDPKR